MDQEMYDDYAEYDDLELDDYFEDEDIDDMIEAMMDEDDDDDDLSERRRRSYRGRRRPGRYYPRNMQRVVKKRVPRASSGSRPIRKNSKGLQVVDKKVKAVGGTLNDVISVNKIQSNNIKKLNKQMKIDGALDFANSLKIEKTTDGDGNESLVLKPDIAGLYRGALKSGLLGDMKGALANPLLIGALAFILGNTDLVKSIFSQSGTANPQ